MIAWRYDFEEQQFELLSFSFTPMEFAAMTEHGGIIVHRADDYALSIVMDGKVVPWIRENQVLDLRGRVFVRTNFLSTNQEEIRSVSG